MKKCPKCGGKAKQISKQLWKCEKCGRTFGVTQPKPTDVRLR